MQLSEFNLGWLCGWLEGEGAFISYTSPKGYTRLIVRAVSTDKDTILKAKQITGVGNTHGPYQGEGNRQPHWHWAVTKRLDALAVMQIVRPHVSKRRQAQIDKAIRIGGPS